MRITEILLKQYKSDLELYKTKLQLALKSKIFEECDELISKISMIEQKINTIQHNSHFLSREDILEAKTWGQ